MANQLENLKFIRDPNEELPKVLIVDDDIDVFEFIKRSITLFGDKTFRVDFATTGEGAVSKLNHEPISAIVLDVKLPDVTGITVAKKVREQYPKLPIALLTSYSGPDIRNEAKAHGVFYWYKPEILAYPEKLPECMEQLIKGANCSGDFPNPDPNMPPAKTVEIDGTLTKVADVKIPDILLNSFANRNNNTEDQLSKPNNSKDNSSDNETNHNNA